MVLTDKSPSLKFYRRTLTAADQFTSLPYLTCFIWAQGLFGWSKS